MSEELKFAALHADDLLLDALGARRPVESSDDVVAGLLQAFVTELDTRPGPLTGLLAADFYDSYDAADSVPTPHPVTVVSAAPPVDLISHRRSGRARNLVAHRAAAVVTVGALVLGVGGVSAAVTGDGGPLDGIRRVVGSVTEQVTPQRSDADRISGLLSDADRALAADDLRSARELLEKARTRIEGAADPQSFSSLRANLIELRDRWHRAFDEDQTADPAQAAEPSDRFDAVPGEGVLDSDGKPRELVGESDVSPSLPVGPESDIKRAKDKVADRAEQKLEPLPALPIDEIRSPTWAPIVGEGGIFGGK